MNIEFIKSEARLIAVTPDGKVFSLHIKERKEVDIYAEGMYNKGVVERKPLSQILQEIAKEFDWEYREI